MNLLRRFASLALFTVFVASALAPAAAQTLQKIRITVPSSETSDAAYFVAAQKGYFAAEGLDVEFVFAGGGTATPALLSGSVDASASGAAALTAILRGAPLRVVLVFTDSPTYKLWGTADIHTLADLKGKAVGIATRGDTFEIATRLALQNAGIPPDSVGYTPLGFASGIGAVLDSGSLPAVVLSTAGATKLQDLGELKKAHVVADFYGNVHMPWNGLAVSEKLLYGDPVLAKKIIRAIVKGSRYMRLFRNETVAMVGKYQQKPNPHASGLDYDELVRAFTPDLTSKDEFVMADLDVRAGMMNLPKDQIPPLNKIYDFGMVRAVNAELNASGWKPTR